MAINSIRSRRPILLLAALLLATLGVRLARLDQPIVENYVGRQIPTAMVARNLERGSGFLHPQLDTGPFPNLFLIEPPVFASLVVAVRRVTGWPIGASGRIVSALATCLAAWGLFGLVKAREGSLAALYAVAAFALFPVTLRYGRACQPDMLMIGLLVAGLRLWDDYEELGGRPRLVAAWLSIALGLAVKIVAAWILIPLIFVILPPRLHQPPQEYEPLQKDRPRWARTTPRPWEILAAVLTLLPALAWYAYAATALHAGGSKASADNAAIWATSLGPLGLLRGDTLFSAAKFLVVTAFTPLGFLFAIRGILERSHLDRLWQVWAASALAGLAMVGGKLHHEYYWLGLAPVAAAGIGCFIQRLSQTFLTSFSFSTRSGKTYNSPESAFSPMPDAAIFAIFAALAVWQSSFAFRTPTEWRALPEAAAEVARIVPRGTLLVAPEALLFAADRYGCRLEFEPKAMARAAGEWRGSIDPANPLALVEFYRQRGAKFVADLAQAADPEARRDLHDAIRRRYNVRWDRDGLLIAELIDRPGLAP